MCDELKKEVEEAKKFGRSKRRKKERELQETAEKVLLRLL